MYLNLIVIFSMLKVWPHLQRWATAGGLLVMCLALSLSSLCNNTIELIVSQGVIYALGGSLTYSPCILYMDEWFDKRKGLAYGIMWAGTGLAGVILPLVMDGMLHTYGFRTTLRVWARLLAFEAHAQRTISFSISPNKQLTRPFLSRITSSHP